MPHKSRLSAFAAALACALFALALTACGVPASSAVSSEAAPSAPAAPQTAPPIEEQFTLAAVALRGIAAAQETSELCCYVTDLNRNDRLELLVGEWTPNQFYELAEDGSAFVPMSFAEPPHADFTPAFSFELVDLPLYLEEDGTRHLAVPAYYLDQQNGLSHSMTYDIVLLDGTLQATLIREALFEDVTDSIALGYSTYRLTDSADPWGASVGEYRAAVYDYYAALPERQESDRICAEPLLTTLDELTHTTSASLAEELRGCFNSFALAERVSVYAPEDLAGDWVLFRSESEGLNWPYPGYGGLPALTFTGDAVTCTDSSSGIRFEKAPFWIRDDNFLYDDYANGVWNIYFENEMPFGLEEYSAALLDDGRLCLFYSCYDENNSYVDGYVQWYVRPDDSRLESVLPAARTDAQIERAMEVLAEIVEVDQALQQGMTMAATGQVEVVEGYTCCIIELGTDHDESFVCERIYAVDPDAYAVFLYDVLTDSWSECAFG